MSQIDAAPPVRSGSTQSLLLRAKRVGVIGLEHSGARVDVYARELRVTNAGYSPEDGGGEKDCG